MMAVPRIIDQVHFCSIEKTVILPKMIMNSMTRMAFRSATCFIMDLRPETRDLRPVAGC